MAKKKNDNEGRCVLTLPLITEPWQEVILEKRFKIMEHLQNSLIAFERRKLRNLEHTKAYRDLIEQIKNADEKERKSLYKIRNTMLKDAGFSEFDFIDDVTPMQKHFVEHIAAHVAHSMASNVWRAFEKVLFGSGKSVHFVERGTLGSIANKQAGTTISYADGYVTWSGGRSKFSKPLKIKVQTPSTPYEIEMLKKEVKYFRIQRKWMKSRFKYYLQFSLMGEPVQKHEMPPEGRVGIDMGTQSIAYASQTEVGLLELADHVSKNHDKLKKIQRKMDASKRAMNPQNFNEDGTIKRGVKLEWTQSNRYKKLRGQARELQRKNADIRKYQHNCLANHLLTLGNTFYLEQMNYSGLQHRAKETTVNEKGRYNKKKRFGKSLANKAPAAFVTLLGNKLKAYGLYDVQKVNTWEFKASQYDHLSQKYKKKNLSQRDFKLENGDYCQRDLYSAFLLMNADNDLTKPNQELCNKTYSNFKTLHDAEVERIRNDGKPHLSSFGIA